MSHDVISPSSSTTRPAWGLALLPVLALLPIALHPRWLGVWIGCALVAVLSTLVAYLDSRGLRRSGVDFDEAAWPSALVMPPAYLVQRTLAARSSWLIPAAWVAAAAVVAGVVWWAIESKLPKAELEGSIQSWMQTQGIQGGVGVSCPDVVGRRGTLATCRIGDGSTVKVELLGGSGVELRMGEWKGGLVTQTMASWLGTRGIIEPLRPSCPDPSSQGAFEVACTLVDGSNIRMNRGRDGVLRFRIEKLGPQAVGEAAKSWVRAKGGAASLETTADCPALDGTSKAKGLCRFGDGSRVRMRLFEHNALVGDVVTYGGKLLGDTIVAAETPKDAQGQPTKGLAFTATCPDLNGTVGSRVRCRADRDDGATVFDARIEKDQVLSIKAVK